jgi:uncharacterized protein (TIGR02246 family)
MERPGDRRKLGAETAVRLRDLRATKIQVEGDMKACRADLRWTNLKYSKFGAKVTGCRGAGGMVTLATMLLAACAGRTPPPPSGARQAIEAAVARYVAASNRGDAETLASLYADDAMLLPPDHEPIRGRQAIGDFWRQGTDEGLRVTTLTVEVDGNIGYLVGRYNLPSTDEEPADSGKYVMCLKRQRDGSWKLTADIWNRSGEDGGDEEDGGTGPAIT